MRWLFCSRRRVRPFLTETCPSGSSPRLRAGMGARRSPMKGFIDIIMAGGLAMLMKRYADMALAGVVVLILSMFIVPVPPFVLDLLITINISISMVMLLIAIYIPNALALASFPSIILITTLFRLSISIASTRLILLTAHAGEVLSLIHI